MPYKAYVIDPLKRTIEAVMYENHRDISRLVSAPGQDDPFCLGAILEHGQTLYVNDNGLSYPELGFFAISGGHQPYAGKGFLCGPEIPTGAGETTDPTWELLDVMARVRWLDRDQAMLYLK